jgi:hypothetical protein
MSSLADLTELVGFFSYSRRDDEHSEGALSRLRARIYSELRLQLGRDFRLWQDTAAITEGALWEEEIKRAIAESVFFIPIVTPSAVGSKHCRFEFESFLKREAALGRNNLIFPLLYVRVPGLEKEEEWRRDDVLKIIGARQYIDWQRVRLRSFAEPEVAEKVEQYCGNIIETLRQPWVSPEERRAEEDRVRQEAEEDARRFAERQRLAREAEQRRRTEETERLARGAEQRREAEEEERRGNAVDAARRAEEARRQEGDSARRAAEKSDEALGAWNPLWRAWSIGGAAIAVVAVAVLVFILQLALRPPSDAPPAVAEAPPSMPPDDRGEAVSNDAKPSGRLTATGRSIIEFGGGQSAPEPVPQSQPKGEFTATGRRKLQ